MFQEMKYFGPHVDMTVYIWHFFKGELTSFGSLLMKDLSRHYGLIASKMFSRLIALI